MRGKGKFKNLHTTVAWLYSVTYGERWRIMVSCITGIFEVVCSLGFVWASKKVIDIATGTIDGSIWIAGSITISLLVAQLLFAGIDMWLSGCMPVDISNRLRSRLFEHLLQSYWKELEKYHTGDILNRVNRDVDEVVRLLTVTIPAVFVTSIQFAASFIYFCKLDSSLAWILLAVVPIFLLISKLYVRRMREYNRNIRKSDSHIQSVVQESMQHHIIIKTLEQVQNRLYLLSNLQTGLRSQVKSRTRLSLFSRIMMSAGFNSGYLLVFLWGAVRLSRGEISFGTMTAFLQLVGRVQRPAFDLTSFLPSFITSYTAAERLIELETLQKEENGEPILLSDITGLIFRNVTFSYTENGRKIVDRWNADFHVGTTTAVLGETGAGKTTLIRLILALITPCEGEVILTTSIEKVHVSPRTRINFVYVPQGNTLFSGTIRDNLLMGNPRATEEKMKEVLHIAAADFVFDLPEGMDTKLTEQGGGLSEGQAQRIAIARALLREGNILLFDEATSALDAGTERQLMNNLNSLRHGKIIIFITHHEVLAKMCDRMLSLAIP